MSIAKYEQKEFCGKIIRQRLSDGYLNATDMCKANGKFYGHYIDNNQTKEYLNELSSDIGIPISELIEIKRGGVANQQGTWVHPYISIHLSQWLSPKLAVLISKWVFRYINGDLTLIDEIKQNNQLVNRELESIKKQLEKKEKLLLAKDKDFLLIQNKILQLKEKVENNEIYEKTGHIYFATSKLYDANNQYRFGFTEKLNSRMQKYQDGRAKNDELYYKFTHYCAKPKLLETIIRDILKHFRDMVNKDFYVLKWNLLVKYIKQVCDSYDRHFIDPYNELVHSNLSDEEDTSTMKQSILLEHIFNDPPKFVKEKYHTETIERKDNIQIANHEPIANNITNNITININIEKFEDLTKEAIYELKQKITDQWCKSEYFINMYDLLGFSKIPYKLDKEYRKNFKSKMKTRGLRKAKNQIDLGKDFCLVPQKVNGSKLPTDVPYFSLNGIKKYKDHKLTGVTESNKLNKILYFENKLYIKP